MKVKTYKYSATNCLIKSFRYVTSLENSQLNKRMRQKAAIRNITKF